MTSKQPLRNDRPSVIDDFDDNFDFNFEGGAGSNNRDPGSPIKRGVSDALKSHFNRPENYREYVGKTLPRQYGELFDDYLSASDSVRDATDSIRKQARQPINELAKNLRKKVSTKHKRVHGWLNKVVDSTEDYRPDNRAADKAREAASQVEIANVFAGFQEDQNALHQEREEIEGDRFARSYVKLQSQERLLAGIAKAADHQVRFITGVELPYKRKSLELQYRVAHSLSDMVVLTRGMIEQQRKQLDIVIKNTALPEVQKQHLSENFKQNLRNKFVDKALGGFGGTDGLLGAFTKNLTDSVKEAMQMAMMGVEGYNASAEMDDGFDSSPDARKRRMSSMMAGGFLNMAGPSAAGGLSKMSMRKAPKLTRQVFKGARKIGYARNNAHSIMQQYANGDVSGKDGILRELVGMTLPGRDKDMAINRASGKKLMEGTHFDHATRRSVVEVIPGFLAKILQELQITRTGDSSIKPLSYNFSRSNFETQNQALAGIKNIVAKSSKKDQLADIISEVERSGVQFTPEQRQELGRSLMMSRRSGRTMTTNSLMNDKFFTGSGVGGENATAYSQAFRKHFDGNDRGRFTKSTKGVRARDRFFQGIADTDKDDVNVREFIQELFDAGQGELVYSSGLMTKDGQINRNALYDGLAGIAPTSPTTDSTVPERTRRGRVQPMTRIVQQAAPVMQPTAAPERQSESPYGDRHLKVLEAQQELTRQFYMRNHDDLIAILEQMRAFGTQNNAATDGGIASTPAGTKPSWGQRLKGMFGRASETASETAEDMSGRWNGYWNSTMRDNVQHLRENAGSMLGKAQRGLGKGIRGVMGGLGTAGGFLGDKVVKSRAVGARYLEDFKDGIPRIGDLYVQGQDKVRITAKMLENGEIRDKDGKLILSLADLAEATSDLYDQAGNIVLTQKERMSSYVKANGEIITRVWVDRIKRASGRAKVAGSFAGNKTLQGLRASMDVGGRVGRTVMAFGRELLVPPRDVYVSGEDKPRLFAYLMRVGRYSNTLDGSTITRPTQISGPVMDSDGNMVITDEDFKRGLVDNEGKPFKTLVQRAAATIRTNVKRAGQFAAVAAGKLKDGLQTAGRLAGTFLTRGMDGVRAGGWKRSKASEMSGVAGTGSDGVSLLLDIRNILNERLPATGISGRNWSGSSTPEFTNINAPSEAPEATRGATTTNVLGGIGGMLGGLAGGAVKGLAALTRKGKAGWAASMGKDAAEQTPAEEPSKKEDTKASKIARSLKRLWKQPKTVEKAVGPRKPGDANGDGLRDGSAEELRANWKNINAPTKTLDDVKQAQAYERKNTIDAITGAIMSGFKSLGGLLGGAADLLTKRGGAAAAGGAAAKAGGGVLKGAARAGGWAAGKLGTAARVGGRFLGSGIGGAAARIGGMKAIGSIAGKVAGFGIKRLALGAAGAVAGVAGSPLLAGALAIGGAIWAGKEIYDYFQDKKDPVSKSDRRTFQLLRMAEYGAPLKDYGAHNKMLKMETFLEGAIKISGGKTELDKNHIDGDALLAIAEISPQADHKVEKFLEWFNGRFTPVYLKWMTIAKAAGKGLTGLEDLGNAERLKVLQASANSDGWDVRVNPFGSEELQIGSKEISFLRDAMSKELEEKKAKGKNDIKEQMISDGIKPKDALKATSDSIQRQINGGGSAEERNFRDNIVPAMVRGANNKKFATFSSEGAKRVQSTGLTALQSIRLRMYGFTEPNYADVYAIRCLEDAVHKYVTPDSQGRGTFTGDLTEIFNSTAKFFALSPSDSGAETHWRMWFTHRFLPVYTTLIGQINLHAGVKNEENLERQIDAVKMYAIAQGIAGVPGVWEYDAMPRANMAANVDVKSIEVIINNLKAEADKQKVTETSTKPAATTQEQRSTGNLNSTQTPTRSMPTNDQIKTVKFAANSPKMTMPNTMPDVETEPKGSGGAQPGVKPPPQVGNLIHAPGELATGNNGMQYVKAPTANAIEGLNPEVKRLFLAMAEEYGDLTKQSIQVNRGFVTKEEQADQYARTPHKAAPPGSSLHEFGLALDINTVDANRLEKLGLMRKYGFTRPIGGETWHIEPAGIQHDVRGLRANPGAAAQAVATSVGKGGGGVGAVKGAFRFGGRDMAHAIKVRDGASQEVKAAQGGFAGSIATQRNGPEALTANSSGGGGAGGASSSSGIGGAPAANDKLYASLPVGKTTDDARSLVTQTAKAMGVDPTIAMTTVAMESGFKGDARSKDAQGKNVGSAEGLFQFTKGTWGDMMKKHATEYGIPADTSPSDKRANAILGNRYLQDNMARAKSSGLPQDITSAYMLHFMGPTGGRKAMELPDDAVMATAFPSQAAKNQAMFYNKDGSPRTKAQFLEHVRAKINTAAKDFGISDQAIASTSQPAANQALFKSEPAPRPQATAPRTTVQPMGGFENQTNRDRGLSTAPAAPSSEASLITAMREGHDIAKEQLATQKQILEQTTRTADQGEKLQEAIMAVIGQGSSGKQTEQAPAAPASRAERAMRQVSKPAYRTASA